MIGLKREGNKKNSKQQTTLTAAYGKGGTHYQRRSQRLIKKNLSNDMEAEDPEEAVKDPTPGSDLKKAPFQDNGARRSKRESVRTSKRESVKA